MKQQIVSRSYDYDIGRQNLIFMFHLHNLYFRNACFNNSLYYFCRTNKLHLLTIR